jgi:hypothetical protein
MTKSDLKRIINQPHLLGHYLGFDKLTAEHSEWIKRYWLNDDDYVLQAHRNAYKTTSVIVVGYIWYSLLNPNIPVLLIREETKNAERTLRTIRDLLYTAEMRYLYLIAYGIKDFVLVKDNADSLVLPTKEKVTIEGSLDAIGIGSSLTGRHYPKIIGDDIITIKDRVSRAAREHKKMFLMELENIKTADGSMSISGTPWHKDDGFSILPAADKYPLGTIYIPDLTPEKIEDIRQRTTASLFAANYLLKHISSENRLFDEPRYEAWPDHLEPVGWLDPAYSGSNTTALTLIIENAGVMHVKGYVWQESIVDLYHKIAAVCFNHKCGTLYIETNADKGLSLQEMTKHYRSCRGRNESQNKHYKIEQFAKYYWQELRFAPDCQDEYLSQVLDYEEGQEPDDAPDSLASLIRELKKGNVSQSMTAVHEVAQEWRF